MFIKGECLWSAIHIGYPYKNCPKSWGKKEEKSQKISFLYYEATEKMQMK